MNKYLMTFSTLLLAFTALADTPKSFIQARKEALLNRIKPQIDLYINQKEESDRLFSNQKRSQSLGHMALWENEINRK